ncbi:MAG: putative Ig domain-containing protein, partial [Candidatus Poseidoniaceae archaeon]|nr:putative Ig domain-containing protein [Candidatus Poseidoniaceae archaeon]
DLPAGLNFESSNGTIWGTPTILQIDPVMYTIWANNSGGSVAVNVNITINDEAPDIEYNPDWFVVDKGVWLPGGQLNPPLSAIPTNSGGGIPGGYIHTSSMSNPPGEYNSIAIDSSGFRHVAYYSGQIGGGQYYNLMYATDTSGSWVRYTVDNSVNVGQYTSIALDSNDKVHISYFDDTNTDLKYATNAGGAWATVSVDTSSVGKYTSIAVDSNDAVHISYYDTSFRDLKYATCSAVCSQASSWNNLTIDNTGIVGHTSSIAIDSSDTIHISYRASQLGNIKYATCSSSCSTLSSWTTTTIDNSGEATDPSIVVDSNDDIHIAYRTYNYASSTHNLIHTTCSLSCSSAASWTPTVVTSATGSYGYISIAVDTNDGIHISYGSQTPFAGSWSLDYATCSSSCSSTSSWTNITVDNPPYSARHTSIAVDSNDRVHIVYYQSGAGHGLRHITLDASSNVYGYTISPDLPAGLKLDALTGEISGTALEISANTTYTITARNSGGFDTTTVTIEVVDQLPTVAYSPDDLQLTNNTVSVDLPLTPTLTGFGAITSWELNNTSLPSGILFGSNNGTFYGTPTELWPTTAYKVWANNTGGSSVAYLNITVVDEVPTLSYSPDNLTLTKGLASSDLPLAPSLTGSGAITSWEISPDLPNGLTFGMSNGTIWGTPTSLMTLKAFTIWANNSGGSSLATVNITVNDEVPDISYNPDWFVLTNNTAMSPTATPTNSGGAIPSGIIDSTSIFGNSVGSLVSMTIDSDGFKHVAYYEGTGVRTLKYATDASGSWVTTDLTSGGNFHNRISIVIDSSGALHIAFSTGFTNLGSSNNLRYATCDSSCTSASSWTITTIESGPLGYNAEIAVDSNDTLHIAYGNLTSTNTYSLRYATCSSSCTSASSWTKLHIDQSANVGYKSSIAVDENDGIHISYNDFTNQKLKYAVCTSTCTSASSWSNTSIDQVGYGYSGKSSIATDSDGVIHISYTNEISEDLKYATCSSTCMSASSWSNISLDTDGNTGVGSSITIDSNKGIHISYYDIDNKLLKYAACSSSCTSLSSWTNTSIQSFLYLSASGAIAADSSGNVQIVYQYVSGTYFSSPSEVKIVALDSSSNILGYSISPDLPTGLSLNAFTGEISGTPTALSTNTTYTITARNTGGTSTTTITIEVLDQLPVLSYSPDDLTLTKNQPSIDLPLAPSLTGSGAITSWEISPDLPNGLNFGASNGTIWGIATVLQTSPVAYTVWANNSGGSTSATINITINDQPPDIFYSPDELNLTKGLSSSDLPLSPTNSGGYTQTTSLCNNAPRLIVVADDQNTRHILCANDLYSVTTDGTVTVTSNLIPSTAISSANIFAMEIDDDGNLHIGYTTQSSSWNIHHLTNINGSWQSTNVLPSFHNYGIANDGYSLAVGGDGSLHFTYLAVPNGGNGNSLHYATNQSGSWQTVMLEGNGGPNFRTGNVAIVLNSSDVPHFTYNRASVLKVAKYENNVLTTLFTRSGYQAGSITLDSNDNVHVAYRHHGGGQNLHYSTNESGTWQSTVLDNQQKHLDSHISLDNNDNVYVMSTSCGPNNANCNYLRYINYYTNLGGSWSGGIIISELQGSHNPILDLFINDNNQISIVYNHDYSSGANLLTNFGTTSYGYSISPALPQGLRFSPSTGTISGYPTVLLSRTMFTITANNSGGTSTAYINITVVDQVPTLSYSPDNLTLTKGLASSDLPLAPSLTGSGAITSWEISPDLPNGLNFGTSNGTIWGISTVLQTSPVAYTVWANNSGGSTSATINITINDEAPGSFEYIPENNIWTNNSYVNIGPSFINITTGNGSSWQINQFDPTKLAVFVGDVVYINGPKLPLCNCQFGPLTALNTSNGTSWQVLFTVDNGERMSFLVGDVIYFDAFGNNGTELWAYNTSNNTGWMVSDINNFSHSNPGEHLSVLVGDTIYFSADDGSTGVELWAHNTS